LKNLAIHLVTLMSHLSKTSPRPKGVDAADERLLRALSSTETATHRDLVVDARSWWVGEITTCLMVDLSFKRLDDARESVESTSRWPGRLLRSTVPYLGIDHRGSKPGRWHEKFIVSGFRDYVACKPATYTSPGKLYYSFYGLSVLYLHCRVRWIVLAIFAPTNLHDLPDISFQFCCSSVDGSFAQALCQSLSIVIDTTYVGNFETSAEEPRPLR